MLLILDLGYFYVIFWIDRVYLLYQLKKHKAS